MIPADSPLIEPCSDCGAPATTTAYAGHERTADGYRRLDLPCCRSCALDHERDRRADLEEPARDYA